MFVDEHRVSSDEGLAFGRDPALSLLRSSRSSSLSSPLCLLEASARFSDSSVLYLVGVLVVIDILLFLSSVRPQVRTARGGASGEARANLPGSNDRCERERR